MVGHLDRAQDGRPLICNGRVKDFAHVLPIVLLFEFESCISGKMKSGPSKASEGEPEQERAVSYERSRSGARTWIATIKPYRGLTATQSQKAERKQRSD